MEVVVAYFEALSRNLLGGLEFMTKDLIYYIRCHGKDSNQALPEQKSQILPLEPSCSMQIFRE
jgi:hypothetical protein